MRDELNRREVLAGITAATTSGVASVGNARALSETRSFSSSTGNLDTDATFTLINSPTTKGFNDVVETATGPYALAGGGKLFQRTPSGWEVVFDGGIQGNGKTLVAGDTGSEGRRLWIVGSSGVVGAYDTVRKELTDYSKPKNVTNTWTGISVIGAPGAETIILVNSSGQVLRGQVSVCGDVTWGTIKKPSGNGIYGIDNSHFRLC